MNRHERRTRIAKARRKQTGYTHRLAAAQEAIAQFGGSGVGHLLVQHDQECGIYTDCECCTCVPAISVHPDGGRTVLVIGEDGTTEEVATS
jgi:hypothetical protein